MEDVVWGEYFCYSTTFSALAVGSGMQYTTQEIRIDSDADFQFLKTSYFSTNDNADVLIKFKDDTMGRYLMKSATPLRTVAGRSLNLDNSGAQDFRPYVWPTGYIIRRATTFSVELANTHAVIAPTIYLTFHGMKLRPGIAPWKKPGTTKVTYVYPLPRSSSSQPEGVYQIPANQTASVSISTDKDSNFVCKKITGQATGAVLITVQDMGRDRQWMNTGVHDNNLLGSGAFPNVLAAPRWVQRGSVINITMQDLSGATNNVSVNLIGEKIFG